MITIHVPALPVPQPRQRHRVAEINGKQISQSYTPTKHPVNAYKAAVQMAWQQHNNSGPFAGPVHVTARFCLPLPKSMHRVANRTQSQWHTKKPDIDNLLKSTIDALQGLAWLDDKQICEVVATKRYSAQYDQPGVVLVIKEARSDDGVQ